MSKCCKDCEFCVWRDSEYMSDRYNCMEAPPKYTRGDPYDSESWQYPVVQPYNRACRQFQKKGIK